MSKIAPESFEGVKCKWLGCTGGLGLAGNGCCSNGGSWWMADCPEYENEDDYNEVVEYMCWWDWFAGNRPYGFQIGDKTHWFF